MSTVLAQPPTLHSCSLVCPRIVKMPFYSLPSLFLFCLFLVFFVFGLVSRFRCTCADALARFQRFLSSTWVSHASPVKLMIFNSHFCHMHSFRSAQRLFDMWTWSKRLIVYALPDHDQIHRALGLHRQHVAPATKTVAPCL